jgi:hypothetical protein
MREPRFHFRRTPSTHPKREIMRDQGRRRRVDPRWRKECGSDRFRNSRPHAPNMRWIAVKNDLEGSNQTVSDAEVSCSTRVGTWR